MIYIALLHDSHTFHTWYFDAAANVISSNKDKKKKTKIVEALVAARTPDVTSSKLFFLALAKVRFEPFDVEWCT